MSVIGAGSYIQSNFLLKSTSVNIHYFLYSHVDLIHGSFLIHINLHVHICSKKLHLVNIFCKKIVASYLRNKCHIKGSIKYQNLLKDILFLSG